MLITLPHSPNSTIHRTTNTALRQALSADPNWSRSKAALDSLLQEAAAIQVADTGDLKAALAEAVVANLAAGDGLPDDFQRQLTDAESQTAAAASTQRFLHEVAGQLRDGMDQALSDAGRERLLRHLGRQLHELVSDPTVKRLAQDMDGAGTPQAAIDAGLADEWSQAQALDTSYRAIRSAQRRVYGSDVAGVDELLVFANPDDLWPDYLAWSFGRVAVGGKGGSRVRVDPPWPDLDSPEFLLWAVRGDAKLWVPTLAELADARRLLKAAWSEQLGEDKSGGRAVALSGVGYGDGTTSRRSFEDWRR